MRDVQQSKSDIRDLQEEVKQIRQDMQDLRDEMRGQHQFVVLSLQKLVYQVETVRDQDAAERKLMAVQLEYEMLKFERRLPLAETGNFPKTGATIALLEG